MGEGPNDAQIIFGDASRRDATLTRYPFVSGSGRHRLILDCGRRIAGRDRLAWCLDGGADPHTQTAI